MDGYNSLRGRESSRESAFSEAPEYGMMAESSLDRHSGIVEGDGIGVESTNSLHRTWDPTPTPVSSSSRHMASDENRPLLSRHARQIEERRKAKQKKLTMVFGVTIPCILSIFSVVLFLRLGFVLGQAGFIQTMVMVLVGYGVVILTVLSISAIATSSTVEGGGVYFMISRALGPEFGGSVGVIFFVANIFASASYIIGFVEALVNNLGVGGSLLHGNEGIPVNYWYNVLYGTGVLLFCLIVCLVGASLFAKTTFIIFCFVMLSLFSVMSHYTQDYTNLGKTMNFQLVFAIMFNGCTGIMAGANISGDLKNPSVAIPQGTLLACGITFVIYIFLFAFSAFTCTTELLLNNYNYLQYINALPWMITIGVFSATLSAALSTLIGASRVLQALAKDRLFTALGALSCLFLMFYINPTYAGVTIAVMVILFIYLLLRGPATPWGDVSQALIYHQVRKYLLRLDIRKSHVKFWRPEVLLMVSNPRSAYNMIEFGNDVKKGGLYVLGHVITEPFGPDMAESFSENLNTWLTFVTISKMKAFVELIPAPSIRAGTQTLLATAGLGGMKPNTLAMGFYTKDIPINTLETLHNKLLKRHKVVRSLLKDTSLEKYNHINKNLPPLRQSVSEQKLSVKDYVGIINDAIIMKKNICILRHFEYLERESKTRRYIDVWPLCVWQNETFDTTFLLLLQLSCVLHMKQGKSNTDLRIFIVVENNEGTEKKVLEELLNETRINADVRIVTSPAKQQFSICTFSESYAAKASETAGHKQDHYKKFNSLMQQYSAEASVVLTSLPTPPEDPFSAENYVNELEIFTGKTIM
ncbi:Solute carrier family 12 member 9 [Geodia barretti]|uniref:Solute carrier family 12 member 9 n=1 Tax=Geodia barretti TaxID=519541 RepID=A0AA35VWJ1_GEOBA|nr:Solute carrier family 12 member 9 [Geodia barretti]